jgi:UrcA family protein
MSRHSTSVQLAAAVLSSIAGVVPAWAADPSRAVEHAREIAVSYNDIDVTRADGAHILYRRIERAAESVCVRPNARAPQVRAAIRSCSEQAITAAIAKVDADALTQLVAVRR